ncbi:condensation domain-containing protein [Streptomyces sp. MS1.AVA.1]|uniref:Condensation domain-containing protein n=1 Tax=Streptomyces machairae TaxID=3134109 RepID=A0ABU8UQE0_9ACTN
MAAGAAGGRRVRRLGRVLGRAVAGRGRDGPAAAGPAARCGPFGRGRHGTVHAAGRVRERIAETARARGGTPFMAVFAAYAAFVSRLSGSEDLVIGFPVSGRDRPELQDLVGMLTNTLALRVDLSGDPSYHALIDRLRSALLDSQPYQDAPFEAVVNAVARPARSATTRSSRWSSATTTTPS